VKKLREKAHKILKKLFENYPEAKCSLEFKNPVQLLISTILSAQCTDKQVNKVAPILFKTFPTAKDIADSDIDEIKKIIKSTGFYNNKAKSIKNCMTSLVENYDGIVPKDINQLLKLQGVGRKTANVVLGDAFGVPGIVVDTHVGRISQRLGLTNNSTPEKIEKDLEKVIQRENWTVFGHLVIAHGRKLCIARNPKCDDCFLTKECKFFQNEKGEKE